MTKVLCPRKLHCTAVPCHHFWLSRGIYRLGVCTLRDLVTLRYAGYSTTAENIILALKKLTVVNCPELGKVLGMPQGSVVR